MIGDLLVSRENEFVFLITSKYMEWLFQHWIANNVYLS